MEWYLKVMRDNYANFNGRARRKEYWMFTLFFTLFFIASIFIMAILFSSVSESTGSLIGGILIIGLFLTHLVPSLAVTIRRLHDTGKSGWFYLLSFIPYIGGLIIFIFTVIEGDRGDNKYGPDPKA